MRPMHGSLVGRIGAFALVATIPLMLTPESALAEMRLSVEQVIASCARAGGEFLIHEDGGGYGCMKKNCNGMGGTCHVACDNSRRCHGQVPGARGKPPVGGPSKGPTKGVGIPQLPKSTSAGRGRGTSATTPGGRVLQLPRTQVVGPLRRK
jgi:hypothetical protein